MGLYNDLGVLHCKSCSRGNKDRVKGGSIVFLDLYLLINNIPFHGNLYFIDDSLRNEAAAAASVEVVSLERPSPPTPEVQKYPRRK